MEPINADYHIRSLFFDARNSESIQDTRDKGPLRPFYSKGSSNCDTDKEDYLKCRLRQTLSQNQVLQTDTKKQSKLINHYNDENKKLHRQIKYYQGLLESLEQSSPVTSMYFTELLIMFIEAVFLNINESIINIVPHCLALIDNYSVLNMMNNDDEVSHNTFNISLSAKLSDFSNDKDDSIGDKDFFFSNMGSGDFLNVNISCDNNLYKWFSILKTTNADWITHLGGSSGTFLIHFESLLLRLAIDPIYSNGFLDYSVFLVVIYQIENFLNMLVHCNANWCLLFINDYEQILFDINPSLMAIRNVFLVNCQENRNQLFPYILFDSIVSTDLSEYITHRHIQFIVLDDLGDLLFSFTKVPESVLDRVATLTRAFIYTTLSLNIHVALLFDFQHRGRKFYSYIISPENFPNLSSNVESIIQHVFSQDFFLNFSCNEEEFISLVSSFNHASKLSFADITILYFMYLVKHKLIPIEYQEVDCLKYAKMLFISSYLRRNLPLTARACNEYPVDYSKRDEKDEKWYDDQLKDMMRIYSICIVRLTKMNLKRYEAYRSSVIASSSPSESAFILRKMNESIVQNELFDLMDTVFLRNMLRIFHTQDNHFFTSQASQMDFFSVSQEYISLIESCISFVFSNSYALPFYPILNTSENHLDSVPHTPTAVDRNNEFDYSLSKFENTFWMKMLQYEASPRQTVIFKNIDQAALSLNNRNFIMDADNAFLMCFLLDYAHNHISQFDDSDSLNKFLDPSIWKDKSKEVIHKLSEKLKLRMKQKGANMVYQFAASLGSPDQYHHSITLASKDDHPWGDNISESNKAISKSKKNKQKQSDKVKLSAKALDILKKQEDLKLTKLQSTEKERVSTILSNIHSFMSRDISLTEVVNFAMDIIVGTSRCAEELISFNNLCKTLNFDNSRFKVVICLLEILYSKLKQIPNIKKIKSSREEKEIHCFLCFSFQFVYQAYSRFERLVTADVIILIQNILLLMGFIQIAKKFYDSWVSFNLNNNTGHEMENQDVSSIHSSTTNVKNQKLPKQKKKNDTLNSKLNASSMNKRTDHSETKVIMNRKDLENAYVPHESVIPLSTHVATENEYKVQLKFMGEKMERSLGSTFDHRVRFNPDTWQIKLLDVIDERRCALVCAPTGSGKTFVCYYAMEKVLTLDNQSVCVYVCPSKALAHQVQHEVSARFISKDYPPESGICLTGTMLTGFYPRVTTCQILVTTPSHFEILLMSSYYRDLMSRIKYTILDEIHCIGEDDEEGKAWQRLIQLLPSPFIALSATIGNPEFFQNWLVKATLKLKETFSTNDKPYVEVITFSERYADLRCYIYSPVCSNASTTTEILGSEELSIRNGETNLLFNFNPFITLSYYDIMNGKLNRDFYAPSPDVLQAYNILSDILSVYYDENKSVTLNPVDQEKLKNYLSSMEPSNFFKDDLIIKRLKYREYLNEFKQYFIDFVICQILSEKLFNLFIDCLMQVKSLSSKRLNTIETLWNPCFSSLRDYIEEKIIEFELADDFTKFSSLGSPNSIRQSLSDVLSVKCFSNEYMDPQTLYEFCIQLRKLSFLPSLMFNFSRVVISYLAKNFVKFLVQGQWNKYYGDAKAASMTKSINKKRMDEYKALVRHNEMMEKLKSLSRKEKEEQEIEIEEPIENISGPPVDIADEYDEQYNFSNRRIWSTNRQQIEDLFASLKLRTKRGQKYLMEGLRRGIGFHHSGLGRRYRSIVEMLFRIGYLTIVFSTETLSVGVNMPCKTAVFLGNSIQLTPLIFRQTSGRAGRRGFDLCGNVVFWEIPFMKLKKLICAELPILSGDFPVNLTEILRAYQLLNCTASSNEIQLKTMQKQLSHEEYNKKKMEFSNELSRREDDLVRVFCNPLYRTNPKDHTYEEEKIQLSIKFGFRLIADLAIKLKLLSEKGHGEQLFGLATFLHKENPGNIVLTYLLSQNIIQDIVFDSIKENDFVYNKNNDEISPPVLELLTILSYIFSVVPLCHNVCMKMKVVNNFDPLLPPIPPKIEAALNTFSKLSLDVAKKYIKEFSLSLEDQTQHCILPISKYNFNKEKNEVYQQIIQSDFYELMKKTQFNSHCKSPFVSLNGNDDSKVDNIDGLLISSPHTVNVQKNLFPGIPSRFVYINGVKRPLLSNYNIDFMTYRNQNHTNKYSAIDPNLSWFYFSNFESGLISFEKYISKATEIIVQKYQSSSSKMLMFASILNKAIVFYASLKKETRAL